MEILWTILQTHLHNDRSPHLQRPRLLWWRGPVSCCKYRRTKLWHNIYTAGSVDWDAPTSTAEFYPDHKLAYVYEDMPATHTRITRIHIVHSPHIPPRDSDTNVACDVREMQLNHAAKYFWDLRNAYKRNEARAENWRAHIENTRTRAPRQAADGQQRTMDGPQVAAADCCCCW